MTHAPDPVRRGTPVEVTRNACGPLYVYTFCFIKEVEEGWVERK